MNGTLIRDTAPAAYEHPEPGVTELVRGNESTLLERILPLVRKQNVSLDLHDVKRIDAAGLTALIKLYCAAHEAGNSFSIANPSSHVAEILSMVGLEGFLLPHDPGKLPCFQAQLEQTAA